MRSERGSGPESAPPPPVVEARRPEGRPHAIATIAEEGQVSGSQGRRTPISTRMRVPLLAGLVIAAPAMLAAVTAAGRSAQARGAAPRPTFRSVLRQGRPRRDPALRSRRARQRGGGGDPVAPGPGRDASRLSEPRGDPSRPGLLRRGRPGRPAAGGQPELAGRAPRRHARRALARQGRGAARARHPGARLRRALLRHPGQRRGPGAARPRPLRGHGGGCRRTGPQRPAPLPEPAHHGQPRLRGAAPDRRPVRHAAGRVGPHHLRCEIQGLPGGPGRGIRSGRSRRCARRGSATAACACSRSTTGTPRIGRASRGPTPCNGRTASSPMSGTFDLTRVVQEP